MHTLDTRKKSQILIIQAPASDIQEKKNKPKVYFGFRKEIIKRREEINEAENREMIEKNQTQYFFSEKIDKIIEPLARLTKIKKREDTITGKMDLELQILQPTKGQ